MPLDGKSPLRARRAPVCLRSVTLLLPLLFSAAGVAQTNPTPLTLPTSQSWGTGLFSTVPTGFAAWNRTGTPSTLEGAEVSAPLGDATVIAGVPASGGTGGCYGYAVSADARFAVLTSGNSTNGTNQLAMAINTLGQANIVLTFKYIVAVASSRTVGVVCQYRVGTSGDWTTLGGPGNPYVQTGGTAGAVTNVSLTLPPAADNQPVVQIRWATWRGNSGSGNSAVGIDDISVSAGPGDPGGEDPNAPVVFAGYDRTIPLDNGSVTVLMTDATVDDPDGLDGVLYAWTPATGPGISGWTGRTGSVLTTETPSDAQVTLTQPGAYVFTLTATDDTLLTGSDSVTITVTAPVSSGDEYDPPPDYYAPARPGGVWLTGPSLKSALNNIISGHTQRSYDAAKQALQLLDRDPNDPNRILLIYTGQSVSKTWNGTTWNREHQWPDSRNGSGAADSDLHNLRPSNPQVNSSRGNMPYGIGSGYWDPGAHGANDRGDCARAMFYMATRYSNLSLVNGQPGNLQMGDLARMLEWHYSDPVTQFERRRNHLIYSSVDNPGYYQGNRNPYIDHPELVWSVFGSGANNSRLYVGGTPAADGSSTVSVHFEVIAGASAPSTNVVLNKSGTHPTTYDVMTLGSAVTPVAGRGYTFVGGSGSALIPVSVTPTTTPGQYSGSIIIDNTDVSTAGAGMGSADGNDVIDVSLDVKAHANASFVPGTDQNTLTIDFGTVLTTAGVMSRPVQVVNLASGGPTAGLDVDSISGSGATSILSVDLTPVSNIPAGEGVTFDALLAPGGPGTANATYTIHTSDENLPGASAGTPLVLTLTAQLVEPTPGIAGDFDADGDVDATDFAHFAACRTGPSVQQPEADCLDADLDGDGDVDLSDFGRFQRCISGAGMPGTLGCELE